MRGASRAPLAPDPHRRAAMTGVVRATARVKMASIIGSVRRPVNVFCWLGWNEHNSVRSAGKWDLDAVAEPGAGTHTVVSARRLVAELSQAHDDLAFVNAANSRSRNGAQASRSSVVGLFAGGAHLTAAVTHASRSSQAVVDRRRLGLTREPGAMHRPEQPVAAAVAGEDPPGPVGAMGSRREPEDNDARRGIPNPGIGRPQ